MYSTTGSSVIALFLLVGQVYFCSRLLISLLEDGLQEQPSSPRGLHMALRLAISRVLISLPLLYLLQLTLLDIASFCYGVLRLRAISSVGASLGDSGLLWRYTGLSL
jgi:hypothetical protein